MPEYTYLNEETGERIDVIQTMREEHRYFGEDGKEWKRVFYSPNASIDSLSNTSPFDTRAHVEKTGKMKGCLGDLFNVSKEMSERREQKIGGEDPVKRQFFKDYQKKNNGAKHFHDRPDKIETKHAIIDFKATPKKFKES
jgi:hypothetical protein